MVAGAVTARPAGEPARAGASLVLRRGRRRMSSPRWRARSAPKRVLERDRAIAAPGCGRSGRRGAGEIGVVTQRFPGDLLAAPSQIRNKENRGLRVFTPFWRRVQALGDPPKPLPAPKRLNGLANLASDGLEDWKLEHQAGLGRRACAKPGSPARRRRRPPRGVPRRRHCRLFRRSRPARPRRHLGAVAAPSVSIVPRQVWHAARFAAAEHPRLSADIDKFLSELGWREFCRHLLFDVPDLATRNLQPHFDGFPWKHDAKALQAWQRGRTGYPIVDAGMRELWHTGVMHNRVRWWWRRSWSSIC